MTMKKIKLFDYQEDMVKRVQEAFKHHDAVMVQMPTGTGKTMVLANIVFSFLEKSNHPIWIVAHRRELVEQIKETFFSKITPSLFTLKEGNFSKTHPSSLTVKTLELQVGTGLSWKHRFIPWDEPNKVYLYKEGEGNSRLYVDENEQYYVQKNIWLLLFFCSGMLILIHHL